MSLLYICFNCFNNRKNIHKMTYTKEELSQKIKALNSEIKNLELKKQEIRFTIKEKKASLSYWETISEKQTKLKL